MSGLQSGCDERRCACPRAQCEGKCLEAGGSPEGESDESGTIVFGVFIFYQDESTLTKNDMIASKHTHSTSWATTRIGITSFCCTRSFQVHLTPPPLSLSLSSSEAGHAHKKEDKREKKKRRKKKEPRSPPSQPTRNTHTRPVDWTGLAWRETDRQQTGKDLDWIGLATTHNIQHTKAIHPPLPPNFSSQPAKQPKGKRNARSSPSARCRLQSPLLSDTAAIHSFCLFPHKETQLMTRRAP